MSNIAVIPARSGSKGLVDKNIKKLCDKPLIAYTIEAAINSGIFDCVHVSTDSKKYAEIAKIYGADVPFLRGVEFATDTANIPDAVKEALHNYSKIGRKFDVVAILQPTTPLRSSKDICNAYQLFCDKEAISVVSVCEVDYSPFLCNTIKEDLSLNGFTNIKGEIRRQDIDTYYRINGGIYMMNVDVLNNMKELYGSRSYAYIMDKRNSIDIDDEFDFQLAEYIMSRKYDNDFILVGEV